MLRWITDFCGSVLRRDRIRVSPNDGRLLRLRPPCSLTVGTRPVQVMSRRVSETVEGPRVEYECETELGRAALVIRLTRTLQTDVSWLEHGREVAIAEADVVVFEPVGASNAFRELG